MPPTQPTVIDLTEASGPTPPPRPVPRYPTLAHHVEHHPCAAAEVVLVTHLLDTAVPFVRLLAQAVDVSSVVAIPYSTAAGARAALRGQVSLAEPGDLPSLPDAVAAGFAAAARRAKTVIVQEIGGWCAPLLGHFASHDQFGGVVEDTKQGHWRYAALGALPCPVLSIAESPLKALENRRVGQSIGYALERVLRGHFYRVPSEVRAGVLGYGGIGEATAASLAAAGARVSVYDPDPIRMAKAIVDGVDARDRETVLASSDLLIGVSGRCSVLGADLDTVRDGAILASGSSKQVELDLAGIHGRARVLSDHDGVTELDAGGKQVFVLNHGMPVNFADQSVLGDVLDLVYTELYMCIRKLSLGDHPHGLRQLDPAEHAAIAEVWRSVNRKEVAWTPS